MSKPLIEIYNFLLEIQEYLMNIDKQIKMGSDFRCPDCGKMEYHHSTCGLRLLINKIEEMGDLEI